MQLLSDLTLTKANLTPHHHPQQAIKLGHTLAVKLAPPIVLVTPAVARPRTLLNVLVAVHAIPPLLVIRKSDGVLHAHLAPVERPIWPSLDDEPFFVFRSGDLDVVGVGDVPMAHWAAGLVDDVDVPLGGGIGDFEAIGSWGFLLGLDVYGWMEAWGLTVEGDVSFAFACLPVCTPLELAGTW